MNAATHPDDVLLLRVAGEGAEEAELPVLAHVAQCGRCATIVRYVRFAADALRRSAPGLGEEGRGEVLGRVMRTIGEVVPYEGSGGGMPGLRRN